MVTKAIDMPCPECARARVSRHFTHATEAETSPTVRLWESLNRYRTCGDVRVGIGQCGSPGGLSRVSVVAFTLADPWRRRRRDPWRWGARVPNVAGL